MADAGSEATRAPNGRAAPSAVMEVSLEIGDVVVHDRYGRGTVLEVTGEGERAEARVRFDGDRRDRRFVLSWTPLRLDADD